MAGDPINVDANMIYTSTHEEHVAAQFQTPAGATLEKGMNYGKKTPRTSIKFNFSEFLQN